MTLSVCLVVEGTIIEFKSITNRKYKSQTGNIVNDNTTLLERSLSMVYWG